MSLKNKILFVIGVSRGIGLVIVVRVACDGVNVVIVVKIVEAHFKLFGIIYIVVKEIEDVGGKALPLVVDVCEEFSVQEVVDKVVV